MTTHLLLFEYTTQQEYNALKQSLEKMQMNLLILGNGNVLALFREELSKGPLSGQLQIVANPQ